MTRPLRPNLAAEPRVLIGLSGGGDSVALARAGGAHAAALVVDHNRVAGSAERSARAAELGRALCQSVDVARLEWGGRETVSQARLRRARLAALARHAKASGAAHVAFAHTRDDQAETTALRLLAGSHWPGLAGMAAAAPFPLWPEGRGLTLLRPLLRVTREALRERLRADGLTWIEDPANEDRRYARVRVRALRQARPELDAALLEIAAEAAAARAGLDRTVRQALPDAVRFEGPSLLLRVKPYEALPEGARLRLLALLLTVARGGPPAPPEAAGLAAQGIAEGAKGLTAAGVWLRRSVSGVRFERDRGAVQGRAGTAPIPPLPLEPGVETVWDGRLALTVRESGWEVLPGSRGGKPLMRQGERQISLEEGTASGLIETGWLLQERAARELWRGGAAPASALQEAPDLFISAVRSYVGLATPGEGRPMKG